MSDTQLRPYTPGEKQELWVIGAINAACVATLMYVVANADISQDAAWGFGCLAYVVITFAAPAMLMIACGPRFQQQEEGRRRRRAESGTSSGDGGDPILYASSHHHDSDDGGDGGGDGGGGD